jgi:hypothetical protein
MNMVLPYSSKLENYHTRLSRCNLTQHASHLAAEASQENKRTPSNQSAVSDMKKSQNWLLIVTPNRMH